MVKTSKPLLVIVEGPQGVGKTTVTNWIRESIPYSNLYRLTGHNDSTPSGSRKSIDMYNSLFDYIVNLSHCGVNLIFDRIFISEYVYCKLGYRKYNIFDNYKQWCNKLVALANLYEIVVINLYVSDQDVLRTRLMSRGDKPQHHDVKFEVGNSISQQTLYETAMINLNRYDGIMVHSVDTSYDFKSTIESILSSYMK